MTRNAAQRDLAVSYNKLRDVAERRGQHAEAGRHYRGTLAIARQLRSEERPAPTDEWMVDALERRVRRVEGGGE